MKKNIIDSPYFFNSLLLYSDESMEKIKNSRVAVAGVGGIGCLEVELLARQGIENIKVADIDVFSDVNMNRQLFATTSTLGINKAVAAKNRILDINPNCKVEVFEEGINKDNAREFLKDVDVLLLQVDKEAIKVLLHKLAKEMNIPVIGASRSSLQESRWCVSAKLWDYKQKPELPCYDKTNHPELEKYSVDELTKELLDGYDKKIVEKKKGIFKENARKNPELFRSISKEDVVDRLNSFDNYHNRHVNAIVANTAACLACALTVRYLLGSYEDCLKINLW